MEVVYSRPNATLQTNRGPRRRHGGCKSLQARSRQEVQSTSCVRPNQARIDFAICGSLRAYFNSISTTSPQSATIRSIFSFRRMPASSLSISADPDGYRLHGSKFDEPGTRRYYPKLRGMDCFVSAPLCLPVTISVRYFIVRSDLTHGAGPGTIMPVSAPISHAHA